MHIYQIICVNSRLAGGKKWTGISFLGNYTFYLESALRQYDDFLVHIVFQHQTILSAVKCFFEDTEWPCVMVGSAFEGCFLPKHLDCEKKESALEFDFLVRLPIPMAGESTDKTLQYVSVSGRARQVVLNLSDPSIILSEYIDIESKATDAYLKKQGDGFYLKRNFMETVEEKLKNSLDKVLVQKPGGMEIVTRCDITQHLVGLHASFEVSFFKPITEHLDMLPLDPDTWSGDSMTNAQMLWVNLTNWSSPSWPTRIFMVHLGVQCEWPEDARIKWLERDRLWPSENIVQKVAQSSCYLLPLWENPRKDQLIDKEVMEFQFTFGMAEYLLFSETGPKERQCVIILKSLKFKYFSSSQIVSSFVIKTVLFWYLQSTSLLERQSLGRGELLARLLDDLIGFLHKNNLPHFFMPGVNLLENFDAVDINNVLKQLKRVKKNLLDYLLSELFHVKCATSLNEDFVNKVLCFI